MNDLNKFVKNMIKEFDVTSYRIKNKNGIVVKFVKNGINMEVEYENKKNIAYNSK